MQSSLLTLPPELVHLIALNLDINDILNLCLANKQLSSMICDNDNFLETENAERLRFTS